MADFLRGFFKREPEVQLSDEEIDLESFFTDAEHARQVFDEMVGAERLPRRLLVIHGVGGVGKSTLLKMYRLSCRRQHISVALAGGEDAPSPAVLLADWAEDLSKDRVSLPHFQDTLNRYRELQVKVEEEAKKSRDMMSQAAGELGKAVAKGAVEMAASMIPVVGPLAAALGGAGTEAFIDWLRGFLSKPDFELYLDPTERLTADFLKDLEQAAKRRRVVLMADTYEQMTTLSDWMCELARNLPEHTLLIIAGRVVPEWDREWSGWMGRAEVVELKEMTPDDLSTLVGRYYTHIRGGEADPEQVEAIVEFARGLPMVATTVVRLWVRYNVEDFQAVRPQVVSDLVDRLLEGVPPEMRPAFEVAAVLRYFNVESLGALLDGGDTAELYDELRKWPFIRPRREGLTVHDTMREMINESLKVRAPGRFCTLHKQAAGYYEEQQGKAAGEEAERLGLERLYHLVRADEEEGTRLFQETAEELTRYQLVGRLRTLLNDVNSYHLEEKINIVWRDYYNARLAHFEKRLGDAEKIYQSIIDAETIDPKLCAYALSGLGNILAKLQRLGQSTDITEKALSTLVKSLELVPIDVNLVSSITALARVYRYKGEWDKVALYNNQVYQFFREQGDKYGLIDALCIKRDHYASIGEWKNMLDWHNTGFETLPTIPNRSYFRARFLGWSAWAWGALVGQYAVAEKNVREALEIVRQLMDYELIWGFSNNLGILLVRQNRFQEASGYFEESLESLNMLGKEYQIKRVYTLGFQSILLTKQGRWSEAEQNLLGCLTALQGFRANLDTPQMLVWLGQLSEARRKWSEATGWYARSLVSELRKSGRRNYQCEALTGICRVKHAQGDYAAIPSFLDEAEELAQKYEYNDHLASLRLTQGHIAWEGHIPEWGNGFDDALRHYRQALIYALRFNRFLLDEVLWGGGVVTYLQPIIPHCEERGEEGRRMLAALRDWWQTGVNDVGTPRPDTISPIPEGIPLVEAEHIARKREPGDSSPQITVAEKLNAAIERTYE